MDPDSGRVGADKQRSNKKGCRIRLECDLEPVDAHSKLLKRKLQL